MKYAVIFAILICALSFPLTFLEMILARHFVRRLYSIGMPVLRKRIDLPAPSRHIRIKAKYKKNEGIFLFAAPNICLFTSRYRIFQIHTMIPFKCTVTWDKDAVHIKALMPLTASSFFVSFLFVLLAGLFHNPDIGLLIILSGLSLLIAVEFLVERRRLRKMLAELNDLLVRNSDS